MTDPDPHRDLLERFERSETIIVETIGEIRQSIQRNTQRLEEMGPPIREISESIRADTQAVLSALDRLEPGTA